MIRVIVSFKISKGAISMGTSSLYEGSLAAGDEMDEAESRARHGHRRNIGSLAQKDLMDDHGNGFHRQKPDRDCPLCESRS